MRSRRRGQAAAFVASLLGLENEDALFTLAQTAPDSAGVVFVPARAGLGAPHWQDRARGLIRGLALGSSRAHVARASFEAVALQIVDVVMAMENDLGAKIEKVMVDEGAVRNGFLLQLLSDALARPVIRNPQPEASA